MSTETTPQYPTSPQPTEMPSPPITPESAGETATGDDSKRTTEPDEPDEPPAPTSDSEDQGVGADDTEADNAEPRAENLGRRRPRGWQRGRR